MAQPRMSWPVLVCAFIMLVLVSFTMLWLGDKLNASGMVVTRFMARIQTPLTSQMYPDAARDQITVVMYDQEFLRGSRSAWPISYQDHADWLLRLAGDPNARPRAIFLDITFGQGRDDPTLPALRDALCKLQHEFKVPVFLAALPAPADGKLAIREGLAADPAKGERACFTLVGVDYVPDALDGLAWSYQLSRHRTDNGWQPGPAGDPSQQPSYRSAAMAMAEDVARIDLGLETEPMSLVWGHNSTPQADRPNSLQNCRPGVPDWRKLIPGVVRQLWEEGPRQPLCPYHRTLSMAQLGELSEQQLAPYLAGRYVMVGANVPGYNDFADSPVHRLVPGVHLHAMALDNFLTYRGEYKLNAEWSMPPPALLAPGLLTISAVLVVHLAWSRLAQKFSRRGGVPGWLARTVPCVPARTMLTHLFNGLAWLARLTLQTIVAVTLIALLQHYFRIGMLPVVELVGMTLLAEDLSYMRKLRLFIFGK